MWSAPTFWAASGHAHPLAQLLRPVGRLYGAAVARKIAQATPMSAPIPVICVGNATMGGVGKTPFTQYLVAFLRSLGLAPHILMRGYGGTEKGPLRVLPTHTARDVGDEAVMLARMAPVWVSRDRPQGAFAAANEGADILVMDDGYQNPSLKKDFSFLLIDHQWPVGNGLIFPAGPLRESLDLAMARADAVVIMGGTTWPEDVAAPRAMPMLTAQVDSIIPDALQGCRLVAFAGIGNPQKFFDALRRKAKNVEKTFEFPDHYPYTTSDIADMKQYAASHEAVLVTTEKDVARLSREEAEGIVVIPVHVTVDPAPLLADLISPIINRRTAEHD